MYALYEEVEAENDQESTHTHTQMHETKHKNRA